MKKSELFFAIIQIPVDYFAVIIAGLFAYYFRFYGGESLGTSSPLIFNFREYVFVLLFVSLVWVGCFAIAKGYSLRRSRKMLDELYNAFLGVSLGTVLLILFIFFRKELFFSSRFIITAAWAFGIVFVWIGRILTRRLQLSLYRRGVGVNRVIIIGKDRTSGIIVSHMTSGKSGYEILDVLPSPNGEMTVERLMEKIREWHKNRKVDQIVVADANVLKSDMVNIIDFADDQKIVFKYAADLFETQATNIDVKPVAGVPVVELRRTPLDGWGRIIKRFLDIIGSSIFIALLSPVMLAAAIAIKLDSRGPVFFGRKDDGSKVMRVGKGGEPFHYFKFRSMHDRVDSLRYSEELQKNNLRKGTPMVKIKDDPRITKVGKFMRKFSIDELPEFFLVFMGKMSLVGPRPHLPEEVDKYEKRHKKVLTIKPGVTGLAQVSGRSDLDFDDEVRLDTYYIENWNILMDLKILFKTPFILFRKRSAL